MIAVNNILNFSLHHNSLGNVECQMMNVMCWIKIENLISSPSFFFVEGWWFASWNSEQSIILPFLIAILYQRQQLLFKCTCIIERSICWDLSAKKCTKLNTFVQNLFYCSENNFPVSLNLILCSQLNQSTAHCLCSARATIDYKKILRNGLRHKFIRPCYILIYSSLKHSSWCCKVLVNDTYCNVSRKGRASLFYPSFSSLLHAHFLFLYILHLGEKLC